MIFLFNRFFIIWIIIKLFVSLKSSILSIMRSTCYSWFLQSLWLLKILSRLHLKLSWLSDYSNTELVIIQTFSPPQVLKIAYLRDQSLLPSAHLLFISRFVITSYTLASICLQFTCFEHLLAVRSSPSVSAFPWFMLTVSFKWFGLNAGCGLSAFDLMHVVSHFPVYLLNSNPLPKLIQCLLHHKSF